MKTLGTYAIIASAFLHKLVALDTDSEARRKITPQQIIDDTTNYITVKETIVTDAAWLAFAGGLVGGALGVWSIIAAMLLLQRKADKEKESEEG